MKAAARRAMRTVRQVTRVEDTGSEYFALWIGGAWPPSSDKRMGQARRTGFRFRTQEYRDFIEVVSAAWKQIGHASFGDAWLECELHFVRPDLRRRDTHNTIKTILDALQEAGAYDDDMRVIVGRTALRDVEDSPSHLLVPSVDSGVTGARTKAAEPGLLVILRPAPAWARPRAG